VSTWPIWARVGGQASANYGYDVANAGDTNADGIDDLLVGAPTYTWSATYTNDGAAWLYLGGATAPATNPAWSGHGQLSSARYGDAVAGAGDLNGDGYADVVIGSPYYANGQSFEGKAYVHLGYSGGLMNSVAFSREGTRPMPTTAPRGRRRRRQRRRPGRHPHRRLAP